MYADKKWRNHLKRLWDEISLLALVLSLTLSSSDLPSSLELGPLINLFFLLLGQYSVSVELQTVISGHWINVDLTRLNKIWNSQWVSICPRRNHLTYICWIVKGWQNALILEMHTHTRTMFYTSSVAVCRSLLIVLDAALAFFRWCTLQRKRKMDLEQKKRFMLYSSLLYPPLSDTIFLQCNRDRSIFWVFDTVPLQYDMISLDSVTIFF